VYVVDDAEKLLGRVSLKRLLLANARMKVADIYDSEIMAVYTYQSEEEVAEVMQKYDLEAVPVVTVQGKLVGRITVDDIIDVITEMAEQERKIMAGIAEDVEEDDSVWVLSRARLPWLVIGLMGGIIGARFIGVFEEDLMRVTALAFFIPLIIATGGNVGIQSSALVVQSLASGPSFDRGTWKKFFKTLFVALLNGVVLAGLVYLFILLTSDPKLAFVVSTSLFSVVLLASLLGTAIPLLLEKIGFNPALASGPFITTTIDLLGLLVYFLVAHALYNF
jgi:magnesium transporter